LVNGDKYSTKYELTLLELITYFNYKTSLFVLEYNHKICERKNWDNIFLKNNDKIEIITIVGGG
jgi:sulfur carrier protein